MSRVFKKHIWKNTFGLFEPMVYVMDRQLQLLLTFDSLLFSHKREEEMISFCGKKEK